MKRVSTTSLVLLVILAAPRPAGAEWVIAGFFGNAATTRTYLTLTQPSTRTGVRFDSVDYEGRSFHLPPYYGYRATYFLRSPEWFGIEGEVVHMKVYAQPAEALPAAGTIDGAAVSGPVALASVVERFSLSHGQNLLFVNAVARYAPGRCGDFRTARFVLLARAGVGPTLPHVETTIAGVAEEGYQRGAIAVQAAGGIELRAWKQLHALVEYKFTRCRQSVSAAAGSHIETLLHTHHLTFGLSWHF